MLLPLGDSPNPRSVPVVNYGLILANVAVYVLITLPLSGRAPDPNDPLLLEYVRTIAPRLPHSVSIDALLARISAYDLFLFHWGFRPSDPGVSTLFFSLFLHGGLMHLFGNMLFLWIYGDNVEHRLGGPRYLLAYLGTGVAATLFHTLFALDSPLPLVGASGAISGVLGFYFLWFPRNQVRLLLFLFPFLMDVVRVPARLVLGLYLVVDNLLPFLLERGAGGAGVAHGAHIGGFLAGLAVAKLMDRRLVRGRPAEYRSAPPPAGGRARVDEMLSEALGRGDFAHAAEVYFSLDPDTTRGFLAPAEALELASWLRHNGHPRAALSLYRRYLHDYPSHPSAAEAHLGAGLVHLEALGQAPAAYQHFLDSLDMNPAPEIAARAHAGLEEIEARRTGDSRTLRRR